MKYLYEIFRISYKPTGLPAKSQVTGSANDGSEY